MVAAHPDDEALGCGGTIARHADAGDAVHVLFVADGVTSRVGSGEVQLRQRQDAAERARIALGIASVQYLGLPDNRLDSIALLDVVQPLEAVINGIDPDVVYTHHHGDLNVDHRVVHQAVLTACRPQPGACVREIYTFEVMSSSEWSTPTQDPFLPNYFVDISAFLAVKMAALDAYGREMRDPPHSRSRAHVEGLAKHRGSCVGFDAAEAFMVARFLR